MGTVTQIFSCKFRCCRRYTIVTMNPMVVLFALFATAFAAPVPESSAPLLGAGWAGLPQAGLGLGYAGLPAAGLGLGYAGLAAAPLAAAPVAAAPVAVAAAPRHQRPSSIFHLPCCWTRCCLCSSTPSSSNQENRIWYPTIHCRIRQHCP